MHITFDRPETRSVRAKIYMAGLTGDHETVFSALAYVSLTPVKISDPKTILYAQN